MPIPPDDPQHSPVDEKTVPPRASPGTASSTDATPDAHSAENWGWTRPHQIGIGGLAFICLIFLFVQLIHRPVYWNSRVAIVHGTGAGPPLQRTIDPDTASFASLQRLPGIGPSRAAAVVMWRTRYQKLHPDSPAFLKLSDLHHIRGFGPATLRRLAPYLRFPSHTARSTPPGRTFTDGAGQR